LNHKETAKRIERNGTSPVQQHLLVLVRDRPI